ncbi:MAG: metalloregulator ArsR/SmtB family transcription factor [Gammaproteobacteria bacterium]|nr:metalloregulator ArsR/SmtB family transcription factor [Gammaproteobacteria bacterium]MCY4357110.1 metalloregulator ArsR/SmtB family transcription factor [Gammaproteobacteria bacterium]
MPRLAFTNTDTAPQLSRPVQQLGSLHKALADVLRLQVLRVLKSESFGVLELSRIMRTRQSALSHHLKILATADLVSTRREGNSIFYRRAFLADHDPHREIKAAVYDRLDSTDLPAAQQRKIRQIQLERSQQSLGFFNRNATRFREKQGLIVEHADYHGSLLKVIEGLGIDAGASVLEVGPGEGQLLVRLHTMFNRLTALDNSRDMLQRSRAAVAENSGKGVTFIEGDTKVARKRKKLHDLIIFDMVLHHISSPPRSFRDSAALLKTGGCLLLAELSSHDQDWVRETCGDVWLGFEESDLNHWAEKAGLSIGQSSILSLRNGFQIQIRVFHKGIPDT